MKTFKQFNESKELQERGSSMDMILSSPDLHGNHIEYHLGMLLGDLLAMMWKILKFILISAPIMAAKALHKRYNKEANNGLGLYYKVYISRMAQSNIYINSLYLL